MAPITRHSNKMDGREEGAIKMSRVDVRSGPPPIILSSDVGDEERGWPSLAELPCMKTNKTKTRTVAQ